MMTTYGTTPKARPGHMRHAASGEVHTIKPLPQAARHLNHKRARGMDRFAALAQATGHIVWTLRADGSIEDAAAWCGFTGQTAEQVTGWGWLDAVHPRDRQRTRRLWERRVAKRAPFNSKYRARRHDGVYRFVAVRAVPVRSDTRSITEWVVVAADVTEYRKLKRACAECERERADLREHITTLLESISDGFLAVDKSGLLTYVNASVEQVLGKRRTELVGHNVRELFPEALAVPFYSEYERVLADGTPAVFEAFYPPLGMWFETRMYPTADGVTAYLNDSTGRRQIEEQLAQALAREQAAHVEAERRRADAEAARIEAENASKHLLQLQQVTDTAMSHLALADLVPAVLDRICEVMAVDSAAILLQTEDGQALTVYAGRGALVDRVRIPLGQGIAGRIAANRQPQIVDDLAAIEVISPHLRDQLSSTAGVPLLVEGRCIGVLLVGSEKLRQFAEPDVRLLQLVGDRIALAIDRVQLYELARAGYAEAEARASELEATFAAMTDGVFVADQQGRKVRSNLAFRQLLGLDKGADIDEIPPAARSALVDIRDAQGRTVSPDRLPTARILQGEVLEGPSALDLSLRALDGRIVEANVTGAPVRTTDGGIVGAVAVYRDVTERRKLERRNREAVQSLLGMAEVLVEPAGTASEATTSDTSPAIQRLAELTCSLLGCYHTTVLALDAETEELTPVCSVGWPEEGERRWQAQGGQIRLPDVGSDSLIQRLRAGEVVIHAMSNAEQADWQLQGTGQMLLAPLRIGSRLVGLLGLDYGEAPHEFTLEEQFVAGAVAQLCAAVSERERLLREREEARAGELASREATRRMELFMALAGHELRTPLTAMKGFHQLADQYLSIRLPDVEIAAPVARVLQAARGALAQAEQASVRLTGLLDDLLQVSRAQAGKLHIRPQPCDLIAIVSEVVDEQRHVNPTRQMHLRLSARRRAAIFADPQRIGQVVTNYLTNAFKYSPADQPVDVRVEVRERTVRVSVRDRGPGLSAADQTAIWERFYQAHDIQRQVGSDAGLGLGLYLSRTIIEQHEGQVGVDSSPGRGSTFWFTLPRSTDAD